MKFRKISSLVALSAGIMLLGGVNAKAESPFDSFKGQLDKEKAQSHVVQGFNNSKLDRMLDSQRTKGLFKSQKSDVSKAQKFSEGYSTQELTGNYLSEVEPNDFVDEADYLPRGDIMLGTFYHDMDLDSFAIEIPQNSTIGIIGAMPTDSLSDIGFVLTDEYDNIIDPGAAQFDDHLMTAGYNLPAGVYFIRALNIGEFVTNDEYAIAWDYIDQLPSQDVTPPSAPQVDRIDDNDTILTGTAESNSTIEVSTNGGVISSAVTGTDGKFGVYLPNVYPVGTVFNVTATDPAGNTSTVTTVRVVSSVLNGWFVEGGKSYHYTNGVKDKGWYLDNGRWFFLDKQTGEKRTGWVLDGGKWYFLDSFGVMKTGWVYTGGSWYYLSGNGSMKTGWLKDGGSWYYLKSSGAMATGWVQVGTKWYYLYSNGKMAYSTWIGKYRLGADGAWIK
ncbi:Ig-like domain-containing protein [Neobacillus drentensis]|uniref:Ig-like domain-containing protein n=1 Tax=Neobacillus drentensis TaxID=220684 RepID=UPI002FFF183D